MQFITCSDLRPLAPLNVQDLLYGGDYGFIQRVEQLLSIFYYIGRHYTHNCCNIAVTTTIVRQFVPMIR